MKRLKRLECTVSCTKCFQVCGVVHAFCDPDRPGVWANVSEPETLPKFCALCGTVTERIPADGRKEKVTLI